MTAVQFNHQNIKLCDFPQIQLEDFDERCGEVFITLSGTIVFHCSHCASYYGSADNYLDHLSSEHYIDVPDEEIEDDAEAGRCDDELLEDCNTNNLRQEQKLVNAAVDVEDDGDDDVEDGADDDVNDDDIDEYEKLLQNQHTASLDSHKSEHNVDESKQFVTEKIIIETNTEAQTSHSQHSEENQPKTTPKRQYRKRVQEFICKECGKEFKTNLVLKRHLLIHSDERKYKCQICAFAFKDRANLDAHVRRHLGKNKIECSYCAKTFFTQTEVRNHQRIHTGERPYVCTTCGKAFATPNYLKTHNKRHTSEPTFKCNYCNKAFYEKVRYEDHILVHTKEKNFVCEICASTFSRYKSWMRHAKLHEH